MGERETDESGAEVAVIRSLLAQEAAKKSLKLPVLPQVAVRVMTEVSEPSCNAARLSKIIENDPGMTARILRTANSAFYAGITEIASLPHAIGRLGSSMVVAVTVGSVSRNVFTSPDATSRAVLENSWQRSVHAAAASFRMAEAVRMDRESCFTLGLLHAIGEPVLVEIYARAVTEGRLASAPAEILAQATYALVPLVGARLLEEWGLPALIHEAVRHQRAPDQAPRDACDAAALCGLAAQIARESSAETDPSQTIDALLETRACALIRVARDFLTDVLPTIARDARELRRVFDTAAA